MVYWKIVMRLRTPPMVTLIKAYIVVACILFTSSYVHSGTCEKQGVTYYIGANINGIFTEDVLDEMAECAGMVILNTPYSGDDASQSLKSIVEQLHQRRSSLSVLISSWVSVWYERTIHRISGKILSGVQQHDNWLLAKRFDKDKKLVVFPDIREQDYRSWLVKRIISNIEDVGADGVMVDMAFRSPEVLLPQCKNPHIDCAGYKEGFDQLFVDLKKALGTRLLFYNGIFSKKTVSVEDQLQLLKTADGAMIEYFGMTPKTEQSDFIKDIKFYYDIIQQHPDKKFLFFGRDPWSRKKPEESRRWEQYLYAAYLLIENDNFLFKFHASFQVPSHVGTKGGLYLLPEQRVSLGTPIGKFKQTGRLYERFFTKGYVALCQDTAKDSVTEKSKRKSCELKPQLVESKRLVLQPGEAVIFQNTL